MVCYVILLPTKTLKHHDIYQRAESECSESETHQTNSKKNQYD